jgi:hypothetical protein
VFTVKSKELLKEAIEKSGSKLLQERGDVFVIKDKFGNPVSIDLRSGQMKSQYMPEKQLSDFGNSLKRQYSLAAIDQVAKKNKWMKKQLSAKVFQLNRY